MKIAEPCVNLAIAAMAIYGAAVSYAHYGIGTLKFYTVLSNLFAALACLLVAVFQIIQKDVPEWAYGVQLSAATCLAVTFLVVLFVLAPDAGTHGYRVMFTKDDMLYHHLLCPILMLVVFILMEHPKLPRCATVYAMLPTLAYGVITLVLNILKKLDGPYAFLHVYEQPVIVSVGWFLAIIGGSYGIAAGIRALAACCSRQI